jgi:hypothetical protein
MPTSAQIDRFLSLIRPVESGCWEWSGTKGHHGYTHSLEHNAKIAASKQGKSRPWTPEWRAKFFGNGAKRKHGVVTT